METNVHDMESFLTNHGIKPTANRLLIGRALLHAHRPLSMIELEDEIETIDKSVIFRTLMSFKEHHLVHVIEDGSDCVRYELCLADDINHDDDVHAHFYCECCHTTYCLFDVPVPSLDLPEGYRQTSVNFLIKGICPACRSQKMGSEC